MPIDTSPEDPQLVDALVQLSFTIQAIIARIAAEHDLSLIQVRLVGILRDRNPGMLELARYLNLDKSSITGLVARAEKRGLVQRSSVPEDGRAIRVTATVHGRALAAEIAGQVDHEVNQLLEWLSDTDQQNLLAAVSRLIVR